MLTSFDKSIVAVIGGMLATLGTMFPVVSTNLQTLVITLVTAVLVYFVPNSTPPVTPVSNTVSNTVVTPANTSFSFR